VLVARRGRWRRGRVDQVRRPTGTQGDCLGRYNDGMRREDNPHPRITRAPKCMLSPSEPSLWADPRTLARPGFAPGPRASGQQRLALLISLPRSSGAAGAGPADGLGAGAAPFGARAGGAPGAAKQGWVGSVSAPGRVANGPPPLTFGVREGDKGLSTSPCPATFASCGQSQGSLSCATRSRAGRAHE
jgi:hypothetical protein